MPAVAVPLLVANCTLAPLARLVPVRVTVIEAATGSVVVYVAALNWIAPP